MSRFRRNAAVFVGLAVLGWLAYAMFRGLSDTADELTAFRWPWYAVVLLLTLVNYALRFVKWGWLLGRVGVRIASVPSAWIFVAGLAMVITPGKAGELVKPLLVREVTGAPLERTIPVLVVERLTDGIAIVALAALGVSTYASDGIPLMVATVVAIAAMLGVMASRTLSMGIVGLIARLPILGGLAPRLEAAWLALRTCLSPGAFVFTMALSMVAWWAECVGCWLVFLGLDATSATLDMATFIYAFATVFGAPSPGGMGMADAAIAEGALQIVPGLGGGEAVAAALLIRVATLWFGVALGGLAMLRIDAVLRRYRA
jgi:uncharacterized membrane protein YbhN (UPF0104 family)